MISLCVALAAKVGREQGPDDNLAEESGCNQVVEDYKWRGKYEHPGDGAAKDEDRAEDEDTGKAMRRLALVLIFEALAGRWLVTEGYLGSILQVWIAGSEYHVESGLPWLMS